MSNAIKHDEDIQRKTKKELTARLITYLKPFKTKVILVTLLLIAVMAVGLMNPYLMKISIDKYVANKDYSGLIVLGTVMVFLNIMAFIASRYRIKVMGTITNKIVLNIRHELYTHVQKLSFSFFDDRPVGKILARIIGDVQQLEQLFSEAITSLIPETLTIICVSVIMLMMNFQLALTTLAIVPFLYGGLFFIETFSRKKWELYSKKRSNLNAYIHEDFSGIRVIQSFAAEEKTAGTFKDYLKEASDTFMQCIILNDFFWPMVELSYGVGMILIYFFSVKMIDNGSITVGTLVAFTFYLGMFWRPIMNLSNFYNSFITNMAAADRIFEILDISPDIISAELAKEMPEIKGKVEFKDVTFEYKEGIPVLDNVSFEVKEGETIALVGPTGAGKTTIVNLLSRFYDTKKGKVLVDGKDVKAVDLYSLRKQMGIMMQDTFLFSTTIKENIKYGKLDATDEEITEAARAVGIHDFIMTLEKGYETKVNERGSRLSVGQRQLISLARALLANPRILILDEATSNIDTETEILVQQGIKKLLKNRTSFVIAHRLSTIRDADRIFFIKDGNISEAGTHKDLIAREGDYYDLYMSQFKFLYEGV